MRYKKYAYLMVLFLSLTNARSIYGAEKPAPASEPVPTKGTQFIKEGGKVVRELVDKNDDGKPDITIEYVDGMRHHGQGASHFDGKIDTWYIYNEKGFIRYVAKDTNGDGKPDQFITMVKGRVLMLREYDRNFDGKIDKRQLVEWSPTRLKIPGQSPIPGYSPVWTEFDNNYDGKIDAYTEKGNKAPSTAKIGQLIDPLSAIERDKQPQAAAQAASEPGDVMAAEKRKIKDLNDRHGLQE